MVSTFQILQFSDHGSVVFAVDIHGNITLKPGATPDESATAFIAAVKKLWPKIFGPEAKEPEK